MQMDSVSSALFEAVERLGISNPVFGMPIQVGMHTVVPVSATVATYAGGEGHSTLGGGSGGAVSASVIPIGFLDEVEDRVEFHSIPIPDGLMAGNKRASAKEPAQELPKRTLRERLPFFILEN